MEFTQRELLVLELALINRSAFLTKNITVVPGAEEKLHEAEELRKKVITLTEKDRT